MVCCSYNQYNARIFQRRLPPDLPIAWSKRLNKTAGITICKRSRSCQQSASSSSVEVGEYEYAASIELSTKVVDNPDKLRQTLAHECCHVAAFILNHEMKPPHGPAFKAWGQKAEAAFPNLAIRTCHNYQIDYKYQYSCTACGRVYGRHSKSIDTERQRCSCGGSLRLMPKVKQDGTPAAPRTPTAFSMFVKENYANTKTPGTPHASVMKSLSELWKQRNAKQAEEVMPPSPSILWDQLEENHVTRHGHGDGEGDGVGLDIDLRGLQISDSASGVQQVIY